MADAAHRADGALDLGDHLWSVSRPGCTVNQARPGPLAITINAQPSAGSVWIRLVGDVVMGAEPALADAIERVSRSRPVVVVLDLTAVTFVCSTFANFVADVHAAVPDASLLLHKPSQMARLVLAITGLDKIFARPDDTAPICIRIPGP